MNIVEIILFRFKTGRLEDVCKLLQDSQVYYVAQAHK